MEAYLDIVANGYCGGLLLVELSRSGLEARKRCGWSVRHSRDPSPR